MTDQEIAALANGTCREFYDMDGEDRSFYGDQTLEDNEDLFTQLFDDLNGIVPDNDDAEVFITDIEALTFLNPETDHADAAADAAEAEMLVA